MLLYKRVVKLNIGEQDVQVQALPLHSNQEGLWYWQCGYIHTKDLR